MLILNAEDVRQALPMTEAIEGMKRAYAALSGGSADVPLRTRIPVERAGGESLFMPALVRGDRSALGIKIVSVFEKNPEKNLPLIHAAVLMLDPETGQVAAMLEGGTLTAIRTGAGAGAATDILAREDARKVAILGAGVQARTQLEAVCAVRAIEQAWVYAPRVEQVQDFITDSGQLENAPKQISAASSADEALRDADIVCAATTSATPTFEHSSLKAGVHINGVGSYTPEMQEVPGKTVEAARVVVDSRLSAQVEAGDIVIPLTQGQIEESEISEIGEIILSHRPGRQNEDELTFFKSVGVAAQDAVAGQLAYERALELGLGTEVPW